MPDYTSVSMTELAAQYRVTSDRIGRRISELEVRGGEPDHEKRLALLRSMRREVNLSHSQILGYISALENRRNNETFAAL